MANGISTISPQEARFSANELNRIADNMNDLLENISKRMEEINSEETKTYQGSRNPQALREELDRFRSTFHKFYEQINKFSANIIKTADMMENH